MSATTPTVATPAPPRPVLLLILDGFGHRVEREWNAIAQADAPTWRRLLASCPHTLVDTHGLRVGLPDMQMGNSEVGHMNIGAGRVVYQDLTRIEAALRDGSFCNNPALIGLCDQLADSGHTLHVLGLLSDGGVHSHETHIFALLDLAASRGVQALAVHVFSDGRDTPPRSVGPSIERLEARLAAIRTRHGIKARIASLVGRYYAMDRDQRWERVEPAYQAIAQAKSPFGAVDAAAALAAAYMRGETDEFIQATAIGAGAPVRAGDGIVHMNFRADRARELSQAFVESDFAYFERGPQIALAGFVSLTEYSASLAVSAVAFLPQSMQHTLGETLAERGLRQLRIAETEKYAHVTFFLNGGREEPFAGEDRVLVPSPKVATYDLQPEMSLPELTDRLVEAIESMHYDAIICNVANPDMVGHTGVFAAAVKAVEAVDQALARIEAALRKVGGEMLITADHGNVELMRDPLTGEPHTQHTVGPVPLVYVGRRAQLKSGGALQDLAPTLLDLMGQPKPLEMTGQSLIQWPST